MDIGAATTPRPGAWAAAPGALRRFAAVAVAGGLAGLLAGGLGSRIAMRVSAVTARDLAQGLTTEAGAIVGRITFGGTLFLVLFAGVGAALIGTAFYLATLAWLPRSRWVRAPAFGGLELLVFGTVLVDPGNPDFTILGRPLLNVLLFGSLFVLHGTLLVLLVRPSGRLVTALAGGARWRARLVDAATFLAIALVAFGGVGLLGQAGRSAAGGRLAMATLLVCGGGLALLEQHRTRPITRPALWAAGAAALAFLAISGALELREAVTTIV